MLPTTKSQGPSFTHSFILFVVALAGMAILYYYRVVIATPIPSNLGDGDAAEYHLMAHYLVGKRDFANIMFGLRPPLLPVMIAVSYALFGEHVGIVVFFNIILAALTVVLVYKVTTRLLKDCGIAFLAAFLLSVDFAFVDANVSLMSEPLHNFLLVSAIYFLITFFETTRWKSLLLIALLVSLAFLVRPGSVYLPLALALVIILHRWRDWVKAAALVALCLVPYIAWSFRNLHYRDSFSFSTSGPFTMLFYRAVSVESHATGRDPHEVAIDVALEVERRMGNDYVTREDVENYPVGRDADRFTTSGERESLINHMALERFLEYPGWMLVMTGVSFVRQFIPSLLPFPNWLQYAQIVPCVLFGIAGYYEAFRRTRWTYLLVTTSLILYFLALPSLVHSGLYTSRYRTIWLPFGMMYTALGINLLYVLLTRYIARLATSTEDPR